MMPGTYACRTNASLSRSSTAVSEPSSCSRHSSTRSAASVKTAKLVPAPSYVAPRGYASPGQTCMDRLFQMERAAGGAFASSVPESDGTTYDLRPSYRSTRHTRYAETCGADTYSRDLGGVGGKCAQDSAPPSGKGGGRCGRGGGRDRRDGRDHPAGDGGGRRVAGGQGGGRPAGGTGGGGPAGGRRAGARPGGQGQGQRPADRRRDQTGRADRRQPAAAQRRRERRGAAGAAASDRRP